MGEFTNNGFVFRVKWYDALKWVALVLLPSVGSLYFGLGHVEGLHLPAVEQVVGSISVIDAFFGLILRKTAQNNIAGDIIVKQHPTDGSVTGIKMSANRDPLVLDDQSKVSFNVKRETDI